MAQQLRFKRRPFRSVKARKRSRNFSQKSLSLLVIGLIAQVVAPSAYAQDGWVDDGERIVVTTFENSVGIIHEIESSGILQDGSDFRISLTTRSDEPTTVRSNRWGGARFQLPDGWRFTGFVSVQGSSDMRAMIGVTTNNNPCLEIQSPKWMLLVPLETEVPEEAAIRMISGCGAPDVPIIYERIG